MKNIFNKLLFVKKTKAFTLIELLLFMGLFSILMLVLLRIFTTIIEQQAEAESYSAVESDRMFIYSRLTHDIARASSITTPPNPGDQGQNLTLVIDGQGYTYSLQNGNLLLTSPLGTDMINQVGTTIPLLNFRKLGNVNGKNTINILMTVQSKIERPQGVESKTINTTVGTR